MNLFLLDLNNNSMTYLNESLFQETSVIIVLAMRSVSLSVLSVNIFHKCKYESVDLRGNQIHTLTGDLHLGNFAIARLMVEDNFDHETLKKLKNWTSMNKIGLSLEKSSFGLENSGNGLGLDIFFLVFIVIVSKFL
ncbi:hypothetical protein Zmor_018870 [Zophobas morio]|uniref:Uncharacterized protein n=1 Tax=Zophobas morio TaxID=2755281 RepID=A0AA38IF74_9CUCU|nr:hypothetical protein Zmor_018870 [Zophobas morio]